MNNLNYDPIEVFFEDTKNNPDLLTKPRDFSILYLLIRDIETCFGLDPSTELLFRCTNCDKEIKNSAQWPALMGILAGIDLLGKFYAGTDRGSVGARFKNFIKEFFELNDKDEESSVLYELRNSMLHSFGLYSKKYNLELRADINSPFIKVTGNQIKKIATINVLELFVRFLAAKEKYHKKLIKSDELKRKFNKMFIKYGLSRHYPINNISK